MKFLKKYIIIGVLTAIFALVFFQIHMPDRMNNSIANASNDNEKGDGKTSYKNTAVPILLYHVITTKDKLGLLPSNMEVTTEELDKQFGYLKANGYETIFYSDLYDFLANKKTLPKMPIIISFDDGYLSNYTYLPAILKKYNMKAEIAIITNAAKTGETAAYKDISYFNWSQAKDMEKSGLIHIVSHTVNHVKLPLSNNMQNELQGSYDDILSNLGHRSDVIVYPEGRYNRSVIDEALKCGYKMGVTVDSGINFYGQNPMKIKRIIVSHGDTGKRIVQKINRYRKLGKFLSFWELN